MPEKTITLHIRVPEGLAQEIRKISRETNTPQGTAIKYLIEQARNDQVDTRLTMLEQSMRKETKRMWSVVKDLTGYLLHERAMKTLNEISEQGETSEDNRKELEDVKELLEKVDRAKNNRCYELVCSTLEEY